MGLVFMGSPEFSVPALEKLAEAGYEIAAVYTQPDRPAGRGMAVAFSPVKQAAQRLGLTVMQPENFKDPEEKDRLEAFKPDIIVVCAYGQILPGWLLEMPPRRCINVHFSLLPRHRGASPVASAILAGDKFTGVTIMIVTPKLDTGPVLAQAAVSISPRDTTGGLLGKLAYVGADLLAEALNGWLRGEILPLPQDESKANYFAQIKKEEGRIDWQLLSAIEIARRVRAFSPWPGCYTSWRGRQLKILEAEPLEWEKGEPGKVITLPGRADAVGIITRDGVLEVLTIQLEGKKVMSTSRFLRGQPDLVGSILPN